MNATSIFKTALGSVGSFFGGIQTYLIVGAVSAALAFGGGIWLEHGLEQGVINGMKLADAKYVSDQITAVAKLQQGQDKITLDAAIGAQKAFDDLHVRYVTLTQEITPYVTPVQEAKSCLTVGLARSLRADADGSVDEVLQLAPGQSDDDCSDVTEAEVAGWFKAYAEASEHNAQQINLLEAEIVRLHDSYNAKVTP